MMCLYRDGGEITGSFGTRTFILLYTQSLSVLARERLPRLCHSCDLNMGDVLL